MLGVSLAFSNDTVSLEFGEIDTENQVVPVLYDSPGDIAAFKFYVLGMDVTNVSGGIAGDNNYFLNQGSTCWRDNDCKDVVLGFPTNPATLIPSGSGILLYLNYAEIGDSGFDVNILVNNATCLDITEGFILDSTYELYDVEIGECIASPEDCNNDYYGSAFYDDCDICSEGNTDHLANSDIDCTGTCFGIFSEDDCGICDDDDSNDCFTYIIDLHQGANLISFHALPVDRTIHSMFSTLAENDAYIIGESSGNERSIEFI